MIRMKEVAAAAGVSTMTVSKAYRDLPDISAATKKRVLEAGTALGYVYNAGGRICEVQEKLRDLKRRMNEIRNLIIAADQRSLQRALSVRLTADSSIEHFTLEERQQIRRLANE